MEEIAAHMVPDNDQREVALVSIAISLKRIADELCSDGDKTGLVATLFYGMQAPRS